MPLRYSLLGPAEEREMVRARMAELERAHFRAVFDRAGVPPDDLARHDEAITLMERAHVDLRERLDALEQK